MNAIKVEAPARSFLIDCLGSVIGDRGPSSRVLFDLVPLQTFENVLVRGVVAQTAVERSIHVTKLLLDCPEPFKAWNELAMYSQETLAKLTIKNCDFRVPLIARFLAMEDIDAQIREDRAEVLFDLLLGGLLREVADKNFHCERRMR